jgi:hypothetical protein
MSGRAPLVDAIGAWTDLAPWGLVLLLGMLLAVVLLGLGWALTRERR